MTENIEAVIERYSDAVYRLAYARTGSRFDADEVYQEVFLRYIRKQPIFKDEDHRKAWFLRVTVNCSKKIAKTFRRPDALPLDESIPETEPKHQELYYELMRLEPKYREVIHLFYYEDMACADIARVLGISEGAVRVRLSRARAELKRFMKEEDYVSEGL